jgi:hypothetical protein
MPELYYVLKAYFKNINYKLNIKVNIRIQVRESELKVLFKVKYVL